MDETRSHYTLERGIQDGWLWAVDAPGLGQTAAPDPVEPVSAEPAEVAAECLENGQKHLAVVDAPQPGQTSAREPEETDSAEPIDLAAACLADGQAHLENSDFEAAIEAFDRCLGHQAHHIDASLGKALALHGLGRLQPAMDLYRLVPATHRHYTGVLTNLVAIAAAHNDHSQLRAYSAELLELRHQSRSALQGLLLCAMSEGNSKAAVQLGTRLVRVAPDSFQGWYNALWNLALVAEQDGLIEEAEGFYAFLIEAGHKVSSANFRLGRLRLDRGDNAGAADALERGLREQQDNIPALVNLSLARWRAGDLDAAVAGLHGVLQNNPPVEALRLSAALTIEAGDWKSALELELQLNNAGENTAVLAYNIGVLQQLENLHQEAIASYQKAADQDPNFAEAFLNLGHALNETGKSGEATAAWQAALQAKPELAAAYV